MREWKSQSHVKWYCKYHIVFRGMSRPLLNLVG